jgi:hypothetical protein
MGVTPHESSKSEHHQAQDGTGELGRGAVRNVSQACRVMGVSQDTFYRIKEAKENGGIEALRHKDRSR